MKTDATLFAAAMVGGPEAFAPIVERYQDALFGIALARLGDFHEAQDVAQQAFLEAYERLGSLKDPARLGAWLRSVTIHRCIDRIRQRRELHPIDEAAHVSRDDAPDEQAQRSELRHSVLDAIGRLSKTQRETTTLFYVNGYSVAEVAGLQEVPVGTVKRRLHDAREELKTELIEMVKDVLKSEAPKDDFAEGVFKLLDVYGVVGWRLTREDWVQRDEQIRQIGAQGLAGFKKALKSPYVETRRMALRWLTEFDFDAQTIEPLLRRALTDTHRHMRRSAAKSLILLWRDNQAKRKELLPEIMALLTDTNKRVRRNVACLLAGGWRNNPHQHWGEELSLPDVARALVQETDPTTRLQLMRLIRLILRAQHGMTDLTVQW